MNQEMSQHMNQGAKEDAPVMLMRVAVANELEPVKKKSRRD
jgi:hypothetical protein